MNRPRATALLLSCVCLLPSGIRAQGFGLGVRGGTLGFGGEAAIGLTPFLAIRGGVGYFPVDFDLRYGDIDYTVTPPSSIGSVGIDLFPGGTSFRLMGGVLVRKGDLKIESADLGQGESVEIGGTEYSQAGTLFGVLRTQSAAPFFGIGFGRLAAPGFGVSLDLGVALTGDPEVELDASGPIRDVPGFLEDLDREEKRIQDETDGVLKFWPVLNLGLKIPIG